MFTAYSLVFIYVIYIFIYKWCVIAYFRIVDKAAKLPIESLNLGLVTKRKTSILPPVAGDSSTPVVNSR